MQVSATFGPAAEKLLHQSPQPDLPADRENLNKVRFELPAIDFTPANLITLLFTDQGELHSHCGHRNSVAFTIILTWNAIGVFTPAAVSDELIRLYQ